MFIDLRLKFLTGLMLIVMKISIAVTYMRFGMDIIEDHFIADLSTKYSSSAEFMSFYGLLNFYVYTMVFVYSPSSSATLQSSCKPKNDRTKYYHYIFIDILRCILGQRFNIQPVSFPLKSRNECNSQSSFSFSLTKPNMHTIEVIDVIIRQRIFKL